MNICDTCGWQWEPGKCYKFNPTFYKETKECDSWVSIEDYLKALNELKKED